VRASEAHRGRSDHRSPRERRNEIATTPAIARKINNLEDIHIFTAFRTQGTVRFKRSQSANIGIGVCASGISTLLSGQLKRIGMRMNGDFWQTMKMLASELGCPPIRK
jgi:hypothetical protein